MTTDDRPQTAERQKSQEARKLEGEKAQSSRDRSKEKGERKREEGAGDTA